MDFYILFYGHRERGSMGGTFTKIDDASRLEACEQRVHLVHKGFGGGSETSSLRDTRKKKKEIQTCYIAFVTLKS